MTWRGIIAAIWLVGCAGKAPPPAGHDKALVVKPAESRAIAAFRTYTARRLHVSAGDVEDDSFILEGKHTHGSAQAFLMTHARNGQRGARGWATPDGTVITPMQNLGRLFAEAGVWTRPLMASPEQLAMMLAEDIVWSYSESDRVQNAPKLALAADGSGSLRFVMMSGGPEDNFDDQFVPQDDGGGGGGYGQSYFEVHVAFTSDHKTTLTRESVDISKLQ
jgi:hypothetical protein